MNAPRAWSAIGLLALILVLLRGSGVDTGLHMDDIAQRAMVRGDTPVSRAWWDLYTFSSGEPSDVAAQIRAGTLPWWSDPHLRLSALRPLSSALIWVDAVALSPRAAHVHSLLWWVAMLVALGWALHPVLGRPWAVVAVVLYGLDDAHAMPLVWLANRAAIVSGVFGWLALGIFVRRGSGVALALVSALCLAAGEYGLSALAYVVAYAGVVDSRPWRARLRALLPMLMMLAGYLVVHRVGGFGSAFSGIYVDPAADPGAFVLAWFERAPRLLFDMATGLPLAVSHGWSPWSAWAAALVAMLGLVALTMWVQPDARAIATWVWVGAVLAVVPVSASFLSERLNVLASVGAHVSTAAVVVAAGRGVTARAWTSRTAVACLGAAVVVWGHGWTATQTSRAKVDQVRRFNNAGLAVASRMPVNDKTASDERWVLLTAGDPMMLVYTPQLRAMSGHPPPGAWTVLCLAPGPLTMKRVSPSAVEITATHGWLQSPLERFFRRSDRPLPEHVDAGAVQIEVVRRHEGAPQTIRFSFARSLDDPRLRVLGLGMRGMFRYPLAKVGATMPLASGVDAVRASGQDVN